MMFFDLLLIYFALSFVEQMCVTEMNWLQAEVCGCLVL